MGMVVGVAEEEAGTEWMPPIGKDRYNKEIAIATALLMLLKFTYTNQISPQKLITKLVHSLILFIDNMTMP